jgi:hypothetical protein
MRLKSLKSNILFFSFKLVNDIEDNYSIDSHRVSPVDYKLIINLKNGGRVRRYFE